MAEIQDLLVADEANTGRWPENMEFSEVNDAGRADEGLLARWYKDMDTSIVASGSSNAFAITSNRAIPALFNNLVIGWTANHSITGAATLALNGLAAKNIKRFNGDALAQGDIISGQPVVVVYKSSGDQWFMVSLPAAQTGNTFIDLDEGVPANPATDDARLYAFDDSTVTRVAYKDSAGNITVLYPAATATEMEAQTAARVVTADVLTRHPTVPKAWAKVNQTGTQALDASSGVTSITDAGTGLTRVTMTVAMSSVNYGIVGTCQAEASGSQSRGWVSLYGSEDPTTTTFVLNSSHNGSNFVDSEYLSGIVVGDQ